MKQCSVVFLLALYLVIPLRSQDLSSATWYFGQRAGLSFVGGTPAVITGGLTQAAEGTSVICDSVTGAAIAYTDGSTVWRGDHTVAATNVGGRVGSSTMGGLFVRHPGDPSIIYLFTVEDNGGALADGRITTCSYVGGVFTVGTTQTLLNGVTEKVTSARACNGIDYWVIIKQRSGTFVSYRISATAGFEAGSRVDSPVGLVATGASDPRGEMKISPDGRWLAAVNERVGTELCRFNNATGTVTAAEQFDLTEQRYGVSFSPNSQLLYLNTGWVPANGNQLYQFDLSASPIASSRVSVGTFGNNIGPGCMMIAPDQRIYVARYRSDALGCIQNPNVRGTGCTYVDRQVVFASDMINWGLPNCPQSFFVPRFTGNDTSACEGSALTLGIPAMPGYSYAWSPSGAFSDATLAQPTVTVNGTQRFDLVVTDANGCTINQTVEVVARPLPVAGVSNDTTICVGTPATLRARRPAGGTLLWTPNETLSSINGEETIARPAVTTTYIVTATDASQCVSNDTVVVTVHVPSKPQLAPVPSVTICPGTVRQLTIGTMQGAVTWSTGETTPSIEVAAPGTYFVSIVDSLGCVAGDTVEVVMLSQPTAVATGGMEICAGSSTPLQAAGGVSFVWTPSAGLSDPTSATPTATPDLTTEYFVEVTDANGCKDTASTTVIVRPLPVPLLTQNDTTICGCDSLALTAPEGFVEYVWSNGFIGRTLIVREAGTYSVAVTDDLNCIGTSNPVRIDTFTTQAQMSTLLTPVLSPDGRQVDVQLRIRNWPSLAPCFGDTISWIIEMRSGVLAPRSDVARGVITDSGVRIVSGISTWDGQADSVTISLPYTVTLGDTSETDIIVRAAQGSKCPATISGASASFTVDEICRAGGINRRFLSPARFTGILGADPNPANDAVTVRLRLSTQQSYHLEVRDVLGQVVMQTEHVSGVGSVSVPLDVSGLSPGKYVITLVAGNERSGYLLEVL